MFAPPPRKRDFGDAVRDFLIDGADTFFNAPNIVPPIDQEEIDRIKGRVKEFPQEDLPPVPGYDRTTGRRRPLPPDEPETQVNLDFLYRSELAPASPGARPKVPSNDIELREDSGQGLPTGGDLGGGPTRLGNGRPRTDDGRPLSPREEADKRAILEGRDEDTSFYEQDRINSRNRNPLAAKEGDGLGGSAARPIEYGQPGYEEQWPLAFETTPARSTGADYNTEREAIDRNGRPYDPRDLVNPPTPEEKRQAEEDKRRVANTRPEAFDRETISDLIKQGYTPEEIRRMQMSPRDKERLNDSPGGRSYEAIYHAPGSRESLAVRAPEPEAQHIRLDPTEEHLLNSGTLDASRPDSGDPEFEADMDRSPSDARTQRGREGVQNRERQQSLKNQEMEDRGYVPTQMPGPNGPVWVYQLTPEAKARNRGRASQSRAERMAVLYDAPIPDGAISDDPDVRNAAWGADRLKYLKGKKAGFEARNERYLNQVKMGRRSEAAWSAAGDIEDVDKRDAVRARMLGAPGADEGIAAGNIAAIKNLINQGFKGGGDDDPKLKELKLQKAQAEVDAARREGMTPAEIRTEKAGKATDTLGKARAYTGDSSAQWNEGLAYPAGDDLVRLRAKIEEDHPDLTDAEREAIYRHVLDQTSWIGNSG